MQGVLITAYKNFDSLVHLIDSFNDDFELYIHIDKRSGINPADDAKIRSYKRVKHVSQKYAVNWGSFTHLESCLMLANRALQSHSINRIHFITGEDFCLIPPDKIIERFKHDHANYLQYDKLPKKDWAQGGLNRIEYFNFHEYIQARKYRGWVWLVPTLQKAFRHKREIPPELSPLYGGCGYWTLTRAALQYVLDFTNNNDALYKRFKYTFCAEEIYFQTILMNSPLAETVINDYLRFINWHENEDDYGPPYLDKTYFDEIKGTNKIFGRKFSYSMTAELQTALWETVN